MSIETELENLQRKRKKLETQYREVGEQIARLESRQREQKERERVQSLADDVVYLNTDDIADPCRIIEIRRTRAAVCDSNGKEWDVPMSWIAEKPHDSFTKELNNKLQLALG